MKTLKQMNTEFCSVCGKTLDYFDSRVGHTKHVKCIGKNK